ncbi:MAG TPA: YggS family pyridoxal phosphate-dependent enzyme [Dehalococcoidia bacterium]|nr:YggS family pyridoxal phosphate-dependent enzyme [Dehalococcoidia bacterium]
MTIRENINSICHELPPDVQLLAAAKSRSPEEVEEAVAAGIKIIGENYVQEAENARELIGSRVAWHFIGHLQKNKVKKAVELFDMIETVDSVELAREIEKRCAQSGKTMPVLIEINSGREPQKSGVYPEKAVDLINEIADLKNIKVMGLMTMGPLTGNPEELRPYFRETRKLYDKIARLGLPRVEMKYLSMGMTDSYKTAIEEGANLVRIGSKIFTRASR